VLSVPGQKEVVTSSGCSAGAVCSAAAMSAGLQGDCSASWLSSETSETVEGDLWIDEDLYDYHRVHVGGVALLGDRQKTLLAGRENSE